MTQLIVFIAVVILLVLLAIQNMAPPITLVLLGSSTLTLPLAVWLLVAIATGAILTLVIYGIAGASAARPYRPLGQRIRMEPPSAPDRTDFVRSDARSSDARSDVRADTARESRPEPRAYRPPPPPRSSQPFVATPEASSPSQSSKTPDIASQSKASKPEASANPYDTNWESFKAPQQWDDWGERPDPKTVVSEKNTQASQKKGLFGFKRPPYSADASVNEIESGWDDYRDESRPARGGSTVDDSLEEITEGWDDDYGGDYQPPRDDRRRESRDGYRDEFDGDDSPYERQDYRDQRYRESVARSAEQNFVDDTVSDSIFEGDDDDLGPAQVGPDGVYEADYRVIIPPYQPLKDEDEEKG